MPATNPREHRDDLVDDSCDEVTYRHNGSVELPERGRPEPDNAD